MGDLSERRLAENEAIFRARNESVQKGLEELEEIAKEEGAESFLDREDTPLHFYCECSRYDCSERVKVKPSDYKEIHKNRNQFVIICGHEIKSVEKIVDKQPDYFVIEKFIPPPELTPEDIKTK